MNNIKQWGIFILLLIPMLHLGAMDAPQLKDMVYIQTSDNNLYPIERWKVREIKVLLVLLEHQKGTNSRSNPIKAPMISSQELDLLNKFFTAIEQGSFENFLDTQIMEEGEKFFTAQEKASVKANALSIKELGPKVSLRSGILRNLINIADRMQANIISSFCLTYILPSDLQRNKFTPDLIDRVISLSADPQILSGHPDDITTAAFSPDGTKLISGCKSQSNNLILWDVSGRKARQLKILNGHPYEVTAAAFSHDGKNIVSGCIGSQNNLIMWNLEKGTSISLPGHITGVNSIALKHHSSEFASGGLDETNNIIIWNAKGKKVKVLSGNPTSIQCFLFSPDDNKILSGGEHKKGNLLLLDLEKPENPKFFEGLVDTIDTIDFSPDGQKIIAGSLNKIPNACLWDLTTEKRVNLSSIQTPGLNIGSTTSAAFSRDGKKIMSARIGNGDNLIVWNAATLEKSWIIPGFSEGVWSATFNQNQNKIIAGGIDHGRDKIMIANIETKHCQDLYHHQNGITSVICNPNGKNVVVCSVGEEDNLVLLSLLSDEEEKALYQCTFAQAYFLYRFFLMITHGLNIDLTGPMEKSIYNSLPDVIKKMIYRYMEQEPIIVPKKEKKRFHISNPFSKKKK